MYLARVTGSVVATQKLARLGGQRLLTVQKLHLDGSHTDSTEDVALDPGLDAGVGDAVLVVKEGAVVADLFDRDMAEGELPTPANVVIVAIVDDWVVGEVASRRGRE
jgi:microcompartment protein CcmK/EutM